MSGQRKIVLFLFGGVVFLMLVLQLALGLTIVTGKTNPQVQQVMDKLIKAHQHTGYLTVALSLGYVVTSLALVSRTPSPSPGAVPVGGRQGEA
jgi:hypothetical protein